MDISFRGKNILVTGAGQGIGRDIAKQLVACGGNVFALSRTKKFLDTLAAEVPSIKTICVDLADWDAARKAVEELGPIHALVNNAAVLELQPFLEVTPDSFDRLFNVNVKAIINVSQVVAKGMVERKEGGSIVNLSSVAGLTGAPRYAVYGAAKGAVEILSKVMAAELGPHNIRVNCVSPTVVLTEMGIQGGWVGSPLGQAFLGRTPLRRFAEVNEVVDTVLYVLSDRASMITGVSIPVDGGYLAN